MSSIWPTLPRTPARRRRLGFIGGASKLLGTSVSAVVPLQRHNPALVLSVSLAEVAALIGLFATGSLAVMLVLVVVSVVLVTVVLTNTRRVLALTGKGNVMMTASISGWPTGVIGPARRDLDLPEPSGLGVKLEIEGATWWVDRSSYRLLRRARLAATAEAVAADDEAEQ
jgi:hypothetical protein